VYGSLSFESSLPPSPDPSAKRTKQELLWAGIFLTHNTVYIMETLVSIL
jgi:hypothetical protein